MNILALDKRVQVVAALVEGTSVNAAHDFIEDLAGRIINRIQLTTDGHRVYAEAVEDAFGSEIDYAMLVKIYGASNDGESRYSPATCIGCRTGVLAGSPDPKHISTSFVERQNLSMRMGMRRFTRLTNGFSKKLENHGHMVALLLHALQLLSGAQDAQGYTGNGGGSHESSRRPQSFFLASKAAWGSHFHALCAPLKTGSACHDPSHPRPWIKPNLHSRLIVS